MAVKRMTTQTDVQALVNGSAEYGKLQRSAEQPVRLQSAPWRDVKRADQIDAALLKCVRDNETALKTRSPLYAVETIVTDVNDATNSQLFSFAVTIMRSAPMFDGGMALQGYLQVNGEIVGKLITVKRIGIVGVRQMNDEKGWRAFAQVNPMRALAWCENNDENVDSTGIADVPRIIDLAKVMQSSTAIIGSTLYVAPKVKAVAPKVKVAAKVARATRTGNRSAVGIAADKAAVLAAVGK